MGEATTGEERRGEGWRTYHSLYSAFQSAFQPSGTLGGGGPDGGTKSAMVGGFRSLMSRDQQ